MTKKQKTKTTKAAGTPRKTPKNPAKGAAKTPKSATGTRPAATSDAAAPATRPERKPRAPANDAAPKARDPRLPATGSTIVREYKGKEIRVTVLDAGFRYDGREYRSLTALALAITGYPAISGPAFFRLAGAAPARKPRAPREPKDAADAGVTSAPVAIAEGADAKGGDHAE